MSGARAGRLVLITSWLAAACTSRSPVPDATPSAPASSATVPEHAAWLLDGGVEDRFVRVAKHLRGFDVAMAETGYRHGELYWAGRDENWGYASYQVEKIETAVANGTERRPKRAASARMLEGALERVKEAIARRDAGAFDAAFTKLTATCNACHVSERVPFIHVVAPRVRLSPVVAAHAHDGGGP